MRTAADKIDFKSGEMGNSQPNAPMSDGLVRQPDFFLTDNTDVGNLSDLVKNATERLRSMLPDANIEEGTLSAFVSTPAPLAKLAEYHIDLADTGSSIADKKNDKKKKKNDKNTEDTDKENRKNMRETTVQYELTVTSFAQTILPKWKHDGANIPSVNQTNAQKEWNRVMATAKSHENRHWEKYEEALTSLESKIKKDTNIPLGKKWKIESYGGNDTAANEKKIREEVKAIETQAKSIAFDLINKQIGDE